MLADKGSMYYKSPQSCPHNSYKIASAATPDCTQKKGGESSYLDCIEEGVLVLEEGACVFRQGVQVAAVLPILLQAQQG